MAALACAAVRGMEPVTAAQEPHPEDDVDAATVDDALGRRWLVRAARTPGASARLETEARLLDGLTSWLPFQVPVVTGSTTLPDGGHAVVQRAITGMPLEPADLVAGPGLTAALGRALAAVHDLPDRLVEEAGMPVYEAEEYRQRRLAEVDRAAQTGHVPPRLLARWERAIEEAGAWRFVPCVVNGDLAAESVLVDPADRQRICAITSWGQARVADPADDLGWLANGADEAAFESVLEAYAHARATPPDRDLGRRARLAGELSLARWLLHGTTTDDAAVVDDAVSMLGLLDATLAHDTW